MYFYFLQGPTGPIGPPGPAGQPGDKVTLNTSYKQKENILGFLDARQYFFPLVFRVKVVPLDFRV